MQEDRPMLVARISAEMFASTDLAEVCEWLQELQHSALRLGAGHLPRAVLCTLWLLEDIGGGLERQAELRGPHGAHRPRRRRCAPTPRPDRVIDRRQRRFADRPGQRGRLGALTHLARWR
jgi:hypothetical protein